MVVVIADVMCVECMIMYVAGGCGIFMKLISLCVM